MVCLLIKEGSLNLGSLIVNQLNIQQRALPPVVLPRLLIVLFGHSRFYFPIEQKRV